MTPEKLTELLRRTIADNQQYTTWTVSTPHLIKLVEQVVAEEREACAKLCEDKCTGQGLPFVMAAAGCAEAIRARGDK